MCHTIRIKFGVKWLVGISSQGKGPFLFLPNIIQEFYKNVLSKADIIQATGDAVAIFQEVQCLTPR